MVKESKTNQTVRDWTEEDERKYREMLATPVKKPTEEEWFKLTSASPNPPLGASKTAENTQERVNHPKHYQHPSGIECITVARHHDFNIGNALKYLFRAGLKQEQGITPLEKQIEDLQKAAFYIQDEIEFQKSKQQ